MGVSGGPNHEKPALEEFAKQYPDSPDSSLLLNGFHAQRRADPVQVLQNLAEGLVVPSARRHGGVNIVYYPSNRLPGTIIEMLDATELSPDKHGLDP